jgi:hypothetical protein
MRKSRIWLIAVAVLLAGTTVIMALTFTPISAVLTGSGPTVTTPTLNGPFWLQPIPPSVIAGGAISASFTVGNPYPFSLINLELIMNFTGAGVTTACVTAGNCMGGSVTVPGSGNVAFTFCSTCSPTSKNGSPEFVIVAIVPELQSGISTMSLTLVFQHPGAYNEQVYFALNAPYP